MCLPGHSEAEREVSGQHALKRGGIRIEECLARFALELEHVLFSGRLRNENCDAKIANTVTSATVFILRGSDSPCRVSRQIPFGARKAHSKSKRGARPLCEQRYRLPSFLSVVQINPRLNVAAVSHA